MWYLQESKILQLLISLLINRNECPCSGIPVRLGLSDVRGDQKCALLLWPKINSSLMSVLLRDHSTTKVAYDYTVHMVQTLLVYCIGSVTKLCPWVENLYKQITLQNSPIKQVDLPMECQSCFNTSLVQYQFANSNVGIQWTNFTLTSVVEALYTPAGLH